MNKYTSEENALEIPCRVWLPSENRAILVDIMHLPIEAMTIDTIAHSLATKNRYNGATPHPYSVATHSVLVSELIDNERLAFEALMHDAAEALVSDVINPIKRVIAALFKPIEHAAEIQLRRFYGLPDHEHPAVKEADTKALFVEQYFLQGKTFSQDALRALTSADVALAETMCTHEISWRDSELLFLKRYKEVCSNQS